jgi:TPR repeat protein
MGENIQREWDEEPLAVELWEALQARKIDRDNGIAMLTKLAGRGSALAMMYLGQAYVSNDDRDEAALGEEWLVRSAEDGSIEGRLQLAHHYERQGAWEKAQLELEILARQGYSPAMHYLGRLFYWGDRGYRDVPKSVAYRRGRHAVDTDAQTDIPGTEIRDRRRDCGALVVAEKNPDPSEVCVDLPKQRPVEIVGRSLRQVIGRGIAGV